MKCTLLRRHLDAYLDGEVDPSMQIDFERHLAECAPCQEQLAFVRACKGHVRTALAGAVAPSSLRSRICKELDAVDAQREGAAAVVASSAGSLAAANDEANRPWIRFLPVKARYAVPAAAAMALAVAAMGASDLRISRVMGTQQEAAAIPMFDDVVKLHASELPSDVPGSQPERVSSYFRDKVRFPVHPVFDANQAVLVGARLSNVGERRAAVLYYNVGGNRLTVVAFEQPTFSDVGVKHARFMGRDLYLSQVSGYTVPVVRDGGIAYAFTGDMDRNALLRLAASAHVH